MSKAWTSGKRLLICDVCQHELIEVRLTSSSAAERPVNGYPPHLVFVPEFGHNRPEFLGGTEPTKADPVEWRVDLAPTYFPVRGQLHLDGGAGVLYDVGFTRSRCRVFRSEWVITLRDVTTAPIAVPRGVYAISVPANTSVDLNAHGDVSTLALVAGHRAWLGNLTQGTIAATAGIVGLIHCHVRI